MDWIRGNEIGHGSFATISLAIPTNISAHLPALMAVKSSESACSASLHHEKQILDLLSDCPQVIQCFGESCSVENGEEFHNLFLEYAVGGSLADAMQSHGGRLPEHEVRRYTKTILEGLKFIHGKGLVHCDIKPRNVLLFGNGEAKIADFGLTKKAGGMEKFELRGSPMYISPESVKFNEYESGCDIWAVGCTVVEMVTGKPAWDFRVGSNVYSLLLRIGTGDELPEVPKDLSEEGRDFLGKCFVKDPKDRWTAEMLLNHPFVVGEKEKTTSPRCPFEFEEWACGKFGRESNCWLDSSCSFSTTERLRQLVGESPADWSVLESWVTVR